jgi:GNAT superfamily N-acetyltransferase
MDYHIKTASFNQIKIMAEWAKNEGWNPGISDAKIFQLADPSGFFVGYLGDSPVSVISTVKYNPEFSFLGFYITHPDFRNQGFGYKIWQHALQYSGTANCGLDGVVAQQENYQKSGFKLAYRNIRFCLENNNIANFQAANLINYKDIPLEQLLAYDTKYFPAPRAFWLSAWLMEYEGLAILEDGHIKGFGVIRPCINGNKIGPLFAEDKGYAIKIFQGLCSLAKNGEPVFLDIPEPNKEALQLVEEFKMAPVFETARMYNRSIPAINLKKIFGVTSFELG